MNNHSDWYLKLGYTGNEKNIKRIFEDRIVQLSNSQKSEIYSSTMMAYPT
jgi:hypothetical protein